MATSSNESDGDHGFQIAPMVDVVFVLLLFFMACAGLKQTEKHLTAPLPSPTIVGQILPALAVDITPDGVVSINGMLMAAADDQSLERLRAWFHRMPADEIRETPLVMRPEMNTEHGRFVQVLAEVNKAGFKKIAFR